MFPEPRATLSSPFYPAQAASGAKKETTLCPFTALHGTAHPNSQMRRDGAGVQESWSWQARDPNGTRWKRREEIAMETQQTEGKRRLAGVRNGLRIRRVRPRTIFPDPCDVVTFRLDVNEQRPPSSISKLITSSRRCGIGVRIQGRHEGLERRRGRNGASRASGGPFEVVPSDSSLHGYRSNEQWEGQAIVRRWGALEMLGWAVVVVVRRASKGLCRTMWTAPKRRAS
ncbi:hypothetical protein C8R46DRAFT_1066769, partial [Mycena filopes]